jgi:N-acylneuraminate cytidylyltransferase
MTTNAPDTNHAGPVLAVVPGDADPAGRPLLALAVAAARASAAVDRVVTVPDGDLRAVLDRLAEDEGWAPRIVVTVAPTRPPARPGDIDRAVALLDERPDADGVRSVVAAGPDGHWAPDADGWLEPAAVYRTAGGIEAARPDALAGARFLPLVVEPPGPPVAPLPRRPKLLVLDFDGVLTDNRVWMDEAGLESVVFDRGDGMGVRLLREAGGVDLLVLSTEENPIVAARCRKLKIPFRQALVDKRTALLDWVAEHGIDLADVAYVGNDVNDLGCLEVAGLAVAVADSHPDVLAAAHVVLTRPGGRGAVREICDLVRAAPG